MKNGKDYNMKYIIIDVIEKEIYTYKNQDEMEYSLNSILETRDNNYKIIRHNFGKIIVIR